MPVGVGDAIQVVPDQAELVASNRVEQQVPSTLLTEVVYTEKYTYIYTSTTSIK